MSDAEYREFLNQAMNRLSQRLGEASLIVWPIHGVCSDKNLYGLLHNSLGELPNIRILLELILDTDKGIG